MSTLSKYRWEVIHVTIILGVITTLAVVTHLTGTPQARSDPSAVVIPRELRPPPKPAHPPTSDPHEAVVGPSGISNRYILVSADRKSLSSTVGELTVRLHVVSLASENLVSPFSSDMLDVRSAGLEPIHPKKSFHMSIPSGADRDQDAVFDIPVSLRLKNAVLNIHYYNYQNEIRLNLPSRAD